MLNTYPYNPFPASTDKLDEAHNAELQQEVDQLKSDTEDLQEDVEKLETDKTDNTVIAPAFDAEAGIYSVGDLVSHDGKLYEFTSAHSTAGAWDETEVTEKTVSDEINTVKSVLTGLSTDLSKIVVKPLTSGSGTQAYIDFVRYARALIAIDTRGTNGANGWATLAGVLSMGYNGSDFKYAPIRSHENYTLEISWDSDNNRYIIQEKKNADDTYGAYLQGIVILAKAD